MSAYTDLQGITVSSTEQGLCAAVGKVGEDVTGELNSIVNDLAQIKIKLAFMSANMGSGANKTKVDAYVTAALT
jgi:hypothetical protein